MYNNLQYSLYETGYPETMDRIGMKASQLDKGQVCVAVLHIHHESLGMLLEGTATKNGIDSHRQCPYDLQFYEIIQYFYRKKMP